MPKGALGPFRSDRGRTPEHFRWLSGEGKLSSYESSPGKLRRFCSVCGSHLVADRASQPHMVLRVATLDEDPHAHPKAHIWVSHDAAWLEYGEDVPSYLSMPSPEEINQ